MGAVTSENLLHVKDGYNKGCFINVCDLICSLMKAE